MIDAVAQLQCMIRSGVAYGQEHQSVAQALLALGLAGAGLESDHPLVRLHRALCDNANTNGMVYLTAVHRDLLAEAVDRMTCRPSDEVTERLLRAATAERLLLMLGRGYACADERNDIALALEALALDPTNPGADHPLIDLYIGLLLKVGSNGTLGINRAHKYWLREAYHRLAHDR
jgi:hypothetical protein